MPRSNASPPVNTAPDSSEPPSRLASRKSSPSAGSRPRSGSRRRAAVCADGGSAVSWSRCRGCTAARRRLTGRQNRKLPATPTITARTASAGPMPSCRPAGSRPRNRRAKSGSSSQAKRMASRAAARPSTASTPECRPRAAVRRAPRLSRMAVSLLRARNCSWNRWAAARPARNSETMPARPRNSAKKPITRPSRRLTSAVVATRTGVSPPAAAARAFSRRAATAAASVFAGRRMRV